MTSVSQFKPSLVPTSKEGFLSVNETPWKLYQRSGHAGKPMLRSTTAEHKIVVHTCMTPPQCVDDEQYDGDGQFCAATTDCVTYSQKHVAIVCGHGPGTTIWHDICKNIIMTRNATRPPFFLLTSRHEITARAQQLDRQRGLGQQKSAPCQTPEMVGETDNVEGVGVQQK